MSSYINSTEGVLYAEIAALENGSSLKLLELNNGGTNDRVFIYYRNNSIYAQVIVGGVAQCGFSLSLTVTSLNKVAVKYKENDFALWVNGVEVGTDASGSTSSAGALTDFIFSNSSGGIPFYGKCKDLRVYNTALSDAELTTLTTL